MKGIPSPMVEWTVDGWKVIDQRLRSHDGPSQNFCDCAPEFVSKQQARQKATTVGRRVDPSLRCYWGLICVRDRRWCRSPPYQDFFVAENTYVSHLLDTIPGCTGTVVIICNRKHLNVNMFCKILLKILIKRIYFPQQYIFFYLISIASSY